MRSTKRLFAVFFCLLVCFAGTLVYGQATASFEGTVSDKAGAVISGASVKITSQATGLIREAKTDDSGHYLVPLLAVGLYTIDVQAEGFAPAQQRDIRLQIDEHRELDFTMQPASVTTNVEVNATEVAVETSNPTLGQVITSEEVAELPLNGRNFVQLATLTPGTTQSTSPASFFTNAASSEAATRGAFSLSSGGSREQETDWLLDGNDNNQLDEGGIAIFSSIDDIQEFKVLTYNYSAEYGERAGPTVLVTTKSGSNQWHGSLFEFFRNTSLDADNYFTRTQQKFNLNQFGGSFGGPIKKDKTFFFLDYQAKMQRQGVSYPGFVPSTTMTTADANGDYDFSNDPSGVPRPGFAPNAPALNADGFPNLVNPYNGFTPFLCNGAGNAIVPNPATGAQTGGTPCNVIPAALINSIGVSVAHLYPTPNVTTSGLGYNYVDQLTRSLNEGTWDVRVDHTFSTKDSMFARFSYDQATNFVPGGSPTWSEANAFGSNQHINNHGRNAIISEQHLFSASTINQATVGFSRIFNHILSFGTGSCEAASLGIPGADLGSACDSITGYPASLNQSTKDCVSCGLTSFQMTSYYSVGDRGYAPYQGGTNVYSLADKLDLIRGRHNISFGLTYRADEMNIRNNAFQDGYIVNAGLGTDDNIGDLLMGAMGVFAAHDQTFLGATVGRRYKMVRPWAEDDWRVTNSLTLNLGLAWSLVTPESEVQNRQALYDVSNLTWYVPKGSPATSGCTNCVATDKYVGVQFDKTAFEPRIGFAWKPLGSEKTAVRGGYAIFHDAAWNQGGQGLWQNPPYYAEVDPDNYPNVLLTPFFSPTGLCVTPGAANCGLSNGFFLLPGTGSSAAVPGGLVYNAPVNPQSYSGTIQAMNRNFRQGIVQQWNLNIEQQLPGNVVLTAGYAGSRSAHLLVSQLNENLDSPSACGVAPGYTLGCGFGYFPYAAPFQTVDTNNSMGHARYDSLQVKGETKSSRHGLYALLGYTWSRNFDSGLTDGLGTPPGALYYPLPGSAKLDWGLSQLNLNNSFTASVIYDLPFGKGKAYGNNWGSVGNAIAGNWHVDVIERATSGFPLFVVDSSNPSGVNFGYNGLVVERPNEVGDPNKAGAVAANPNCTAPVQIHTHQAWFNPCAFMSASVTLNPGTPQQVTVGELGTAPRAPVYGPRFVNTDFSLIKDFPLSFREGMGLQFRAEFFNLFNHPQYWMSGTSGTGEQDINTPSTFGVINATVNNPRLAQFALKLNF